MLSFLVQMNLSEEKVNEWYRIIAFDLFECSVAFFGGVRGEEKQ